MSGAASGGPSSYGQPHLETRAGRMSVRPPRCDAPVTRRKDDVKPDLDILETSFDLIAPRGEELVDTFYTRLFETAPGVKPLFANTDLRKQKSMLLATLVLLRKSLRDLEAITPKLRQLGARHVAYGALPEHYPIVAEVLLASMAEIAGDAWSEEIADAWAGALGLVAGAMLEGAAQADDRPEFYAGHATAAATA
jgi:hemoglobin-like flavoprotein